MPLDVQALGADFVAFTGHKMCGPTGIGVLWGRQELLEDLPPFLGGGEMIETVSMRASTYAPRRTSSRRARRRSRRRSVSARPSTTSSAIGMDKIAEHEHALTEYAVEAAAGGPRPADHRPDDGRGPGRARSPSRSATSTRTTWARSSTSRASRSGSGHHCARPVCLRYGIPATTRASFYLYSTPAEVDALIDGLEHVNGFFGWEVPVKLDSMYQEIILDHYQHAAPQGPARAVDAEVHHVNPTCGDEMTLRVKVDGDGGRRGRVVRVAGLLDLARPRSR